jgi:hypothetical protein
MTDWEAYPRGRKIFKKNHYVVIVPDYFEEKNVMPLFCDVCQISFSNKEDEKTYKLFKCCVSCADMWAYSNKEKWIKGWRPESNKIKKAVEKRFFTNPHIVFE